MKNEKKLPKPVIFTMQVTVCQVCGRRLTSEFGLKNGMGPRCLHKWQRRNAPPDPDQITFFEENDGNENT